MLDNSASKLDALQTLRALLRVRMRARRAHLRLRIAAKLRTMGQP